MDEGSAQRPTESLMVALLLTLTGGFLDAFSFVGHGRVFANSMTGNIVFLGIALADRDPALALQRFLPILAFVCGVFFAHVVRLYRPDDSQRDAGRLALVIEIGMLVLVALLPDGFANAWIVLGIAFTAALQSSIFGRVNGLSYNSTMTTGNLRHFAELLFSGSIPRRDRSQLRLAGQLGAVCLGFFLGALAGAALTPAFGNRSLLVPIAVLLAVLGLVTRARAVAQP